MARIARAEVNRALDLVAKQLAQAGGNDGRVSRAEVTRALATLPAAQRKLGDIFFKFVDHRDFKTGATVTAKDIARAVSYAKEHLIAKYDLNDNGLSKDEIARMSLTGKRAVELARELKVAVSPEPGLSRATLTQAKKAWEKVVEPDWNPGALPQLKRAELPPGARKEFDRAERAARDSDMLDPPVAHRILVGGIQVIAVSQLMHDSFAVKLFDATGKQAASGSGWGNSKPVDW